MSFEGILALLSIVVTFALGIGVYVNNQRANQHAGKKVSVEEQAAINDHEDVIAKRRLEELNRLYERLDELEADIAELKKDRAEQRHIILGQSARISEQNDQISLLQAEAAESVFRERILYHHVKDLMDHIVEMKPPPPPRMPPELVEWFEELERTGPSRTGSTPTIRKEE